MRRCLLLCARNAVRCEVCCQMREWKRQPNFFVRQARKLICFFDFELRVQIRPQVNRLTIRCFFVSHIGFIETCVNFWNANSTILHSSVRICQLLFFLTFKVIDVPHHRRQHQLYFSQYVQAKNISNVAVVTSCNLQPLVLHFWVWQRVWDRNDDIAILRFHFHCVDCRIHTVRFFFFFSFPLAISIRSLYWLFWYCYSGAVAVAVVFSGDFLFYCHSFAFICAVTALSQPDLTDNTKCMPKIDLHRAAVSCMPCSLHIVHQKVVSFRCQLPGNAH